MRDGIAKLPWHRRPKLWVKFYKLLEAAGYLIEEAKGSSGIPLRNDLHSAMARYTV